MYLWGVSTQDSSAKLSTFFISFYVYGCLTCMHVCAPQGHVALRKVRRGHQVPGIRVTLFMNSPDPGGLYHMGQRNGCFLRDTQLLNWGSQIMLPVINDYRCYL